MAAATRSRWIALVAGLLGLLLPRAGLAAVDPITSDHPLWFIPTGVATIDGVVGVGEWATSYTVTRTQPSRDDGAVTIRMMHGATGLYLAAQVQSKRLWADGIGGGAGNRWEVEQDSSVTFYVDPDHSRDLVFSVADRAFGVNLGNLADPLNRVDGGIVRRWKLVRGDGAGGAPDLNPGGTLTPGLTYATVVSGTANDNADTDEGWTTEIFLPWAALNMAAPSNGTVIGLNFDVIFDNEGGYRDLADNRHHPDPAVRLLAPLFRDDQVVGAHSSYDATQPGLRGPVNYAMAMFVDPAAGSAPAQITNHAVDSVSALGARLGFTAPTGTASGAGFVAGYDIRYSTSPITSEPAWQAATVLENRYVPRPAGSAEGLRIAGLGPSTTYYVAVRGVDWNGNRGPLSNVATFATAALPKPGWKGRVIASPMRGALVFEDGTPFVPVGDHLGLSWFHTRQLYPGDVWDDVFDVFQNFSLNVPSEGPYGPYFDMLRDHGINTMRVYLELQNVNYQGNPSPPDGLLWLEHAAGQFNPDMREFLLNVLEEAAARDIYVIFSPFDSFSYDEAFGLEGPWAVGFGGPLASIDAFFQTPQTLDLAKARMTTVIGWANSSPYADHVLGWEALSEWDSWEWTLNAEGNAEAGRETEMRRRAQWANGLAAHIRAQDPDHLVLNSTIVRDPRGPVARSIFFSRDFDALTPHLYTNSNDAPVYNPQNDRSTQPARDNGISTAYFATNRTDRAPIVNGEWGMTRAHWPGNLPQYSASFTQAEDESMFRTMMWSGLASGQAGMGLRITTEELAFNGYLLTDGMRDLQQTFRTFLDATRSRVQYDRVLGRPLEGRISATAPGHSLLAWGISDGAQGVAYVLRDGNVATGTVSGATLAIDGLDANQPLQVQFWSTAAGTNAPTSIVAGAADANGRLEVGLPGFAPDVVVAFAPEPGSLLASGVAVLALLTLAKRRPG